ncbi:hypothetical protein HMSSN139_26700 [Paenibacillus sp. HMSSN-139]|nr:hypothetical protein HMSSN139_26700 [Paenibacillus sp. HMSSN-139]
MKRKLEFLLLIILAVAVILNVWSSYERHKINQQYKKSVDRFESVVDEYDSIAEWMKSKTNQRKE